MVTHHTILKESEPKNAFFNKIYRQAIPENSTIALTTV